MQDTIIVTPEHQTDIYIYSRTKDYVTLEKRARKERPMRTDEDPREAFKIGRRPVWETLSLLSQSLKYRMPGIDILGVVLGEKIDGNNVTYRVEISSPGKNQPFLIFVLSGEAGFNLVYGEARNDNNGSVVSKVTMEFVKVDGVFLPSKWNVSQYYPDGGLIREEIRTMSDMQVNVPIPDSVFSESSYLREGEKLIDYTNNKKEFILKGGKLVGATDANKTN